MSETCEKVYKSPISKLLPFFEKSRNGWKQRHHRAKAKCKRLSNQVRAVMKSRQRWRELVQQQQQRLRELERELEELKRGIA
jgi:peptidoglycan hydrolase CwlO-like protein